MGTIRNEIRRLRFEHGKYSPSLEAAFRIAQVFGQPLESVFHYTPDG